MKKTISISLTLVAIFLSGCSSLGKGVTEALLEQQEAKDTRACEVWGEAFSGIKPHIERDKGKMKVLMIHGVGDHKPGYATEFYEKLAEELGLTVTSKTHKNIQLSSPEYPDKPLGNLRIIRYLNKKKSQEVILYELTWSEITAKEKQVLAYDNSGQYSFRRAEVNDLMKRFSNDTSPDPIIYLGESRKYILSAFAQSFCWMASGGWNGLPTNIKASCQSPSVEAIGNDQYAFVSHSLGSRITIDGLQRIANILGEESTKKQQRWENAQAIKQAFKKKVIPLYMMSNQLPMLQLGRKLPEVSGQNIQYCQPEGDKYAQRTLAKTPIIAFSDPNDLLSYVIPQGFVEKYIDSRLCVDVTNININIAFVYDIFGIGKLANPMDAHIGYDTDDRVVALIAKGIGNKATSAVVNERCRWIETIH